MNERRERLLAIIEPCILAGCSKGGIVLNPFLVAERRVHLPSV